MYSIQLNLIPLDEFKEILTSVDLLPGRRILLDNLAEVIGCLKQKGIFDLEALRKLLQNKKQYSELAKTLPVSVDYLVVLNREINGYVSRPVPLSELDVLSDAELEKLGKAGIRTTKDFYEQCLSKTARKEFSTRFSLPLEKVVLALELSDLLRINGVGPVYARILTEMGIKNVSDYLCKDPAEILEKYKKVNEEKQYTRAKLGIKDVEYCMRFCKRLTDDVEW